MLTAVLFDFNGTLIRSGAWMALETKLLPRAALDRLAGQGAIPAPDAAARDRAEAAFRAARQAANRSGRETGHVEDLGVILEAAGLSEQVPDGLRQETVAALHRDCLPSVELLPGAAETVRRLRESGLRLGIVSNAAYPPFLAWTLERFGLAGAFEHVIVSADVGRRKPGPEIFAIALERMGLSPEEAVYVGDDYEKDVVAPKRAGMSAIWVPQQVGAAPAAAGGVEPDAVVSALDEIPAWIKRWS